MGLALSGADAVVVPSTRQRGCAPQREQRESLERAREGARLASRPHGPGSQRRSSGGARSSDRVGRKAWLQVPVRGTRSQLEVSHTNADKRLCDSWCPRSLYTLISSRTQRSPTLQSDTRPPSHLSRTFGLTLRSLHLQHSPVKATPHRRWCPQKKYGSAAHSNTFASHAFHDIASQMFYNTPIDL